VNVAWRARLEGAGSAILQFRVVLARAGLLLQEGLVVEFVYAHHVFVGLAAHAERGWRRVRPPIVNRIF